ncbi:MAG: methyltransferase domain-containing protein [Acidobacteria bacterium]|nr:methyltransferase domain-containing protein [Acidobacteriota bacterium]
MSTVSLSSTPLCWCGSACSKPFSDDYRQCLDCGSLFLAAPHADDYFRVSNDDTGFYSSAYWLDYLPSAHGQPDVVARARADLPERCLYWLSTVLRFRQPPGKILELGCGPAAFTGLLAEAGFEAQGVEMSPAIVDWARKTWNVDVFRGPLEQLSLPPGSYAGIAAFDVLEHLPRPLQTLRCVADLLEPGGWALFQTPCFRTPDQTHEALVERSDRFLEQMKPEEHVYLYTEQAVERLLAEAGLPWVRFLPALYDYDMFVIAAREPLTEIDRAESRAALLGSRSQRTALALLDLNDAKQDSERYWRLKGEERALSLERELREYRFGIPRTSESFGRAEAEIRRLESERRRTAAELVRAMEDNERLQLELCRLRLEQIETQGRLPSETAAPAGGS